MTLMRGRSPPHKLPANPHKYIGAPGFEPGTSPTRIMGEIRTSVGKALQIALLEFRSAASQILAFCGGFPGIRQ